MSHSDNNLTCVEIYRLVWSKPATWVAEQLCISSVSFAKTCGRAGIPTPPRGYWRRRRRDPNLIPPPLPDWNQARKMPWARTPALEEVLAQWHTGDREKRAEADRSEVLEPVKQVDAEAETDSTRQRDEAARLSQRLRDRDALELLCRKVEQALREQPLQVAKVMTAWLHRARADMRASDPVAEIVGLCAAVAKGEQSVKWWNCRD